ncbi:RNA-directed DNA polymerase from mobile element jockey-like 10, partial [Homarus americanus]
LTKKMQEDQTPKAPQLQVEQTTPLSQISDKKKTLPSERSLKTVKPQAPCNRSQGTEQQAQAVSKHDHRQKRQHPEESRKNSRDTSKNKRKSTSCSSLGAGAQETATNEHTIPNGRGGERLNQERREQLQHQRRGDNDRIAPSPCHLKITHWNVQGLSNKRHTKQAAAIAKNIDVFILQETLMSKDKHFRLPGYQQYSVLKGPNSHGSMILVRATIPSSEVEPVHCGDGVEAQAVQIHLANDSLVVYNIYKPPLKRLEAGELLTRATQELVLIAGDFNAHHLTINPTTTMNQDGHHLVELLTVVPEITLINTGEPIHILGGTLDLTFISTELVPVAQWEVDDELTSDHFAMTTTLRMELLPPPPRPPPRWNTKKANWKFYQDELQKGLSELWRKLRIATGELPRSPAHPQPLQEANRLAEHFAERSSSAQLPLEIRLHLQQVQLEREVVVRHAIEQTDTTDCLARKTSKDTAPGSDGITYSLLRNAGLAGELALLTVINASWSAGKLPSAWKRANIVPIHKPNDPQNFRPISLTACIGKTAERMSKRVNMMRAMTGPKVGEGHVLLRTLNIHAIRSLAEYATPALITLSEWQWEKLEDSQNNAMRVIVKAPMWTKIKNLHMETGLTSFQIRTERLTACFATKLITRTRESDIKNGLLLALNLNRDVFNKKTWLLGAADAVN